MNTNKMYRDRRKQLRAAIASVKTTAATHDWAKPALRTLQAGRVMCTGCGVSIMNELLSCQTMCESCGTDNDVTPSVQTPTALAHIDNLDARLVFNDAHCRESVCVSTLLVGGLIASFNAKVESELNARFAVEDWAAGL